MVHSSSVQPFGVNISTTAVITSVYHNEIILAHEKRNSIGEKLRFHERFQAHSDFWEGLEHICGDYLRQYKVKLKETHAWIERNHLNTYAVESAVAASSGTRAVPLQFFFLEKRSCCITPVTALVDRIPARP